ncbi:hypothetical protein ABID29_000483 [Streptococcus rupicaprae]|uniref:Transglutaminase-like domain-containing protein n=1 Tax=Streptococcus rupicaprae TaxID=759619 RepID=A0ABV2FFN8_9STRE
MNFYQKTEPQRRYAIRKTSACVGSVLIGFFFLAGNMQSVQASENTPETVALISHSNATVDQDGLGQTAASEEIDQPIETPQTNPVVVAEEVSEEPLAADDVMTAEETPKVIETSPEEVKKAILEAPAPNYYEDEQYELSQKEVTVKYNEGVKLELVSRTGNKEKPSEINWYVRVNYPKTEVYSPEKTTIIGEDNTDLLHLDKDGTITSLNKHVKSQTVELWAEHNKHLYRALVKLPGTEETEAIRQDEEANKEAEKIVKAFENLSDVEKAKAAHDWLVDNVEYVTRPGEDQSAYSALVEKKTVCAGYAKGFKLLMDKMGIPCHTKHGKIDIGEYHLWNIIELDGEWYHVDATWDDLRGRDYHSQEHFLITNKDFKLTPRAKREYSEVHEDKMGERYRFYGFEQDGILAKTETEVANVLARQYHETTANVKPHIFKVMAPNNISQSKVHDKLANLLRHELFQTHIVRYGGYNLYRIQARVFPTNEELNKKPITVDSITPVAAAENERLSTITVKLKQPLELDAGNVIVKDARLTNVIKISDNEYKLTLDSPKSMADSQIELKLAKYGYQFDKPVHKLNIQSRRHEQPNATFTATGENTGYLENVKPGMEYRIGQNKWTKIDQNRIELKDISTVDFYVRMPETSSAFASPIQYLEIKKATDPDTVTAKNAQIVGVNTSMEYRLKNSGKWVDCTSNILSRLVKGDYEIRTKATGEYLASNIKTVTVTEGLDETETNVTKQEAEAIRKSEEKKRRRKRQVEPEQQATQEPVSPQVTETTDSTTEKQDVVTTEEIIYKRDERVLEQQLKTDVTSEEAQKRAHEFAEAKAVEKVAKTQWVQGVNVEDHEFVKVTETDAEYFVTKHSAGQGWYDINKNGHDDGDLCAGAVATNMLHWWVDRNKDYIDRYLHENKDNGTYTVRDTNFDFRKAREVYTGEKGYSDQSRFFDIVKQAFPHSAVWTNKILDLYINGYGYNQSSSMQNPPVEKEKLTSKINFFRNVFGGTPLTHYESIHSHSQFSESIKTALEQGKAIGVAYYHNPDAAGHIVTAWGADFDESGKVIAIYVSDSDDGDEPVLGDQKSQVGLRRYRVEEHGGKLRLTSRKQEGFGSYIGFINTLSQGTEDWKKYFKNEETKTGKLVAPEEAPAKPEFSEMDILRAEAEREAERKAQEEQAQREAERKAQEEQAKREAERKAQEEQAKRETERKAQEEQAKREAERKAQEEQAKRETERKAQEAKRDAERKLAEEKARQEQVKREQEKMAKQEEAKREAERKAQEEQAKRDAERKLAEEKARQEQVKREQEKMAKQEEAKREAERKAQEEQAKREAEQKLADEKRKAEAERKTQEEQAKREAERKAQEEQAKREAERKAQEEQAKREAERKAQEEQAKREAERKAQEEQAKREAERKAQEEQAERKAKEEKAKRNQTVASKVKVNRKHTPMKLAEIDNGLQEVHNENLTRQGDRVIDRLESSINAKSLSNVESRLTAESEQKEPQVLLLAPVIASQQSAVTQALVEDKPKEVTLKTSDKNLEGTDKKTEQIEKLPAKTPQSTQGVSQRVENLSQKKTRNGQGSTAGFIIPTILAGILLFIMAYLRRGNKKE